MIRKAVSKNLTGYKTLFHRTVAIIREHNGFLLSLVMAGALFFVGWVLGHSQFAILESNYSILQNEYNTLAVRYDALVSRINSGVQQEEVTAYLYRTDIPTYLTAALAFDMLKGETFKARMVIFKAARDKPIVTSEGEILFWVRDPQYQKIIDAGLIKGEYEFTIVAEESGQYQLTFVNANYPAYVQMYHNGHKWFRDVSILP